MKIWMQMVLKNTKSCISFAISNKFITKLKRLDFTQCKMSLQIYTDHVTPIIYSMIIFADTSRRHYQLVSVPYTYCSRQGALQPLPQPQYPARAAVVVLRVFFHRNVRRRANKRLFYRPTKSNPRGKTHSRALSRR